MIVRIAYFLILATLLGCSRNIPRSVEAMDDLLGCVLLVRVPNLEKQAQRLEEAGYPNKASQLRLHQQKRWEWIYSNFTEYFDFRPVYYFYSEDTESIRRGDLVGHLLDEKGQRDETLDTGCTNFLIADFGEVRNDHGRSYGDDWVIRDRDFKTLERPFPWRRRTQDCIIGYSDIECLNKRLKAYAQKYSLP